MKYLVCTLNDEHYTDAKYAFVDSIEEAIDILEKRIKTWHKDSTFEKFTFLYDQSANNIIGYRQDAKFGDEFLVNEILIADTDAECLCVHYHAYDGVDFDIACSGDMDSCIEYMHKTSLEELEQPYIEGDNKDIELSSKKQIVIDTGCEWEVWDIVEVPKTEETVYLVYTVYQYDGYDNTEVYSSYEKAVDAADQLLFEFKQDGYKIDPDYASEDATFTEAVQDTSITIRLANEDGEVDITLEEKPLR